MSVFSRMMDQEHEKIAILMKALSFYADEETWIDQLKWVDECCADILPSLAEDDSGHIARAALKEINDLPLW